MGVQYVSSSAADHRRDNLNSTPAFGAMARERPEPPSQPFSNPLLLHEIWPRRRAAYTAACRSLRTFTRAPMAAARRRRHRPSARASTAMRSEKRYSAPRPMAWTLTAETDRARRASEYVCWPAARPHAKQTAARTHKPTYAGRLRVRPAYDAVSWIRLTDASESAVAQHDTVLCDSDIWL